MIIKNVCVTWFFILGTCLGCSITDVSHIFDEPSTIFIQWVSKECPEKQQFRISAHHKKYLACDKNDNQMTVISLETNENSATLKNLFPYSSYKIEILSLDNEKAFNTFEVETPSGKPQFSPMGGDTVARIQAISFAWTNPIDSCRLRFGQPNGYWIELWGEDPWVKSSKPLRVERGRDLNPEYYAEKLLPFTSYKLKVFVMNSPKVINQQILLELTNRTLPTVPLAPQELQALSINSNAVRLLWTPRYPPNGLIKKYIIRVGTNFPNQTDNIVWKKMIEVLPLNNACKDGSICHIVEDLEPDTEYFFQVQVENENVNQPSEFSESAIVKTDPLPIVSTTMPLTSEPTQSQPEFSIDQQGKELVNDAGPTNRIIVIVLTPLAIIIVVIICAILLYKVKMRELKIIYHQSHLLPPESFLGSPGYPHLRSFSVAHSDSTPFGTTQRSKSISGHIFGPGGGFCTTSSGISSSSFIQSHPAHVEVIQNRQLPEPPPPNHPMQTSEAVDVDAGSDFYVNIESANDNNSELVSRFSRARQGPQVDLLGSIRGRDEVTDSYGYLKPTFNRCASGIDMSDTSNSAIPIRSYDSTVRIDPSNALYELGDNYDVPHRTSTIDLAENATYIPFNMLRVKQFEGQF